MPTICHIYLHIYTGCHTQATYIFVLFCHVVFMAQCIQMQRGLEMETGQRQRQSQKPKPKPKTENPKPKIPKAAQATRHRQPKNVSAVAVDVGVAVANYMLTRTRKLISHLAQNLKSRSLATLFAVNQRRDSERSSACSYL